MIRDAKHRHLVITETANPYAKTFICNPKAKFRSITGICNNLKNPFQGASKIPLQRIARDRYEDGKYI